MPIVDDLLAEVKGTEKHHFIQRQEQSTGLIKDFRKSQQAKQSWMRNPLPRMWAMNKWHRSADGRTFHRKQGRWQATRNFLPKTGTTLASSSKDLREALLSERLTPAQLKLLTRRHITGKFTGSFSMDDVNALIGHGYLEVVRGQLAVTASGKQVARKTLVAGASH